MKKIIVLVAALMLSGCAGMKHHWDQLEPAEKVVVGVGTAVVVGAWIIRNGESDIINKTCVSTRSIQTGCGDVSL